jgi:hypothetical protein
MNGNPAAALADNLARLEDEIQAACRRAGRSRSEVALMAATKTHSVSTILEAAALGLSLFGENRVQEFQEKHAEMGRLGYKLRDADAETTSPFPGRFHLMGHLQSNKAQRAAEIFSGIDTLDSLRLALRLNDASSRLGRRLPVLIEIKLSEEESKTGLGPESPALRGLLERLPELAALQVQGLMTVPPYAEDPSAARPYFRRLRLLRDGLARAYPALDLSQLSMGMSHDFTVAIEEGATRIRIGTALFGSRPPGPAA